MTVRIPTVVLLAIAGILGSALISFAVAWAVADWRESDYLDCLARVQGRAIDDSTAARQDFRASSGSQDAYEAYTERYDAIWEQWGTDTKACD